MSLGCHAVESHAMALLGLVSNIVRRMFVYCFGHDHPVAYLSNAGSCAVAARLLEAAAVLQSHGALLLTALPDCAAASL